MTEDPSHGRFQFRLTTLLLALSLAAVAAAAVGYYLRQPKLLEFDSRNLGDPTFLMTCREISRDRNVSKVAFQITKGDGLGSGMMGMKFINDIAIARKAAYLVVLKQWREGEDTYMMTVGFTNVRDADVQREFGKQFSPYDEDGKKREYMSVAEYQSIFADSKLNANPAGGKGAKRP